MDEDGGSNKEFECGKGEKEKTVMLVHRERCDAQGINDVIKSNDAK